jgi:hypothetical protein
MPAPAAASGLAAPTPPAALTPDDFAGRLYGSLAPLAQADPDTSWSLLVFCNAIGTMYELVEDWVRDTPDGPGWSLLLDLGRCPDEALPWLGQFAGVRVLPNSTPEQMRQRIASTDGFRRGTPAAIIGAAQATLTEPKTVILRERYGGDPYALSAVTYDDQTPDPNLTYNAILSQKPAGIVLDYNVLPGQDWQALKDSGDTWADVKARYATWDAVRNDEPD